MILCAHGRFDSKDQPNSAIEVLAAKCRQFTSRVRTINDHDSFWVSDITESDEPYVLIGYSDGCEQVINIAHDWLQRTVIDVSLMVLIDPARQTIWDQMFNNSMRVPGIVKQCIVFRRTPAIGPRRMNVIGANQVIPINAGHGNIPFDYNLISDVMARIWKLFPSVEAPPEIA